MKHPFSAAINMNFPIIVVGVLIFLVWSDFPFEVEAFAVPLGPIEITPDIRSNLIIKTGISIIIAAIGLLRMHSRDYTQFFSQQLTFTVHFDEHRLKENVQKFSEWEISAIMLLDNWENHVQRSIDVMNEMLKANDVRINTGRRIVYATVDSVSQSGEGICRLSIVKPDGGQSYQIVSGWGVVKFDFTHDTTIRKVWLPFELKISSFDRIQLGLRQFSTRSFVLRPTFIQYGQTSISPDAKILEIVVVAKMRLWPVPSVVTCLYCVPASAIGVAENGEQSQRIVPIGYTTSTSM